MKFQLITEYIFMRRLKMNDKKWDYEIAGELTDISPEDKLCDYCNGFAIYLVKVSNKYNSFYRCLCQNCYKSLTDEAETEEII